MKLVASLITRNELSRYLEPCVDSLLEFVDEVRVLDDRSDDGTGEWLAARAQRKRGVVLRMNEGTSLFEHESRARNELLRWTLAGDATHVLSIDADEFVADGIAVRGALALDPDSLAWKVCLEEVWKSTPRGLLVRCDGAWAPRECPLIWRVPEHVGTSFIIRERALACGREPDPVRRTRARPLEVSVLHFGWANEKARAARYARYVQHDGGKYHAGSHLASIMDPDSKVELVAMDWPAQLKPYAATIHNRTKKEAPHEAQTA